MMQLRERDGKFRTALSTAERFWQKVDTTGPDDCWEWQAGLFRDGYGKFGMGGHSGRKVAAHRVAWELTNGLIPTGQFVLHRCDNTKCCNPGHLFLGTQAANLEDMTRKGRRASRLTAAQVEDVRTLVASGIKQGAVAHQFGVARSTISMIMTGKNWRDP
jgi:hypothetical protein